MDCIGVHILADLAGDVGLARQGNRLRGERRIGAFLNDGGNRGDELVVLIWHLSGADAFDRAPEQAGGVGLRRLPAIETVAVVRNERNEIGLACLYVGASVLLGVFGLWAALALVRSLT